MEATSRNDDERKGPASQRHQCTRKVLARLFLIVINISTNIKGRTLCDLLVPPSLLPRIVGCQKNVAGTTDTKGDLIRKQSPRLRRRLQICAGVCSIHSM